jgi:hypothetical protein
MEAKPSAVPRAQSNAGPTVQSSTRLQSATIQELQRWFAEEDRYGAELSVWRETLAAIFEKRSAGIILSGEEVKFLARAYTAFFDTPVNLVRIGMADAVRTEFDAVSAMAQCARVMQEVLDRDEEKTKEAWVELERAFRRQTSEAHSARMNGRAGSMDSLKDFYAALGRLKDAVKTHSATPEHRTQDDPERDQTIYLMHLEGRTYGEIALELPKRNSRWKITAKQAERSEKRYRERGQIGLYQVFLRAFGQPDEGDPR